ncbi:NIF family HAD-type phosphatase [Aeromonas veronii]|uniref:NIF family HAD-type phosphatase n=1 Tax=Aeromonas veronii TaxID=654 RepID=UPI0013E9285F|nr:NIF family HAD-type phosphatase [Aeromonas veronii]
MKTVVFDIDGTLAIMDHRREKLQSGGRKNWDAFFKAMDEDQLNTPIKELYDLFLDSQKYKIVIVSGRPERYKKITESWLENNKIYYECLYMRKDGDRRNDSEVKQDILTHLTRDGYKIIFAIDDRDSVVDMWRQNGITCLQCARGDF